jgi:copper chaperone CopZ
MPLLAKVRPFFLALAILLPVATQTATAGEGTAAGEVILTVRGMVCSSCSRAVEEALGKVDGVIAVNVDMRKDCVLVRYDGKRVTPQKLVEVLRKAGYQALPKVSKTPPEKGRGGAAPFR